jgi:hypothetical protein
MMNGVLADIKYNEREKEFYNYLFNSTKNQASNFVEGLDFANLMRKTNLSKVSIMHAIL